MSISIYCGSVAGGRAIRIARRIFIPLGTLVLTACASTGGLGIDAQHIDTQQLRIQRSTSSIVLSPAAWPRNSWWAGFGDPQLNALMNKALQGQPSLRIAEARLRQASAAAGIARSSLFPQINGSLTITRQRFSEHSTVPPPLAGDWKSLNQGLLGASYEIDFWGRNRAAVASALGQLRATEAEAQAARLMLTTTLARAYLRLNTAYLQRDLAQATLAQRQHILNLTQQRVAAEIDSQIELTEAQAALPAVREQIAASKETIALLGNQLAALEGKGPDAGLDIRRPQLAGVAPVALPTDLPADLIGRRPDIVAERWRVEAASQDIKVAKAQFYPNVSLNGFVGLQSLGFSDFLTGGSRILAAGPALSLPIFEGGRLRSNLSLRRASYDAAVETYNATLIAALHDVVDQLVSLRWLDQQIQQQNEALRLSQHAYSLALNRYHSGLANYLQVLTAEGLVLTQKRLVIESSARERELRLNLIRALGGGYQPGPSPAPALARRS